MTRAVLLLALVGCFGAPPDPLGPRSWTCEFIWACGPQGTGELIDFDDTTAATMAQIANDWTNACGVLAHREVVEGRCPFVFCAAPCTTTDGDPQ